MNVRNLKGSKLLGGAKKKASIKMGAFLFVYIPRQTKNVVRTPLMGLYNGLSPS